jgi:anti-sigma factor RsiW
MFNRKHKKQRAISAYIDGELTAAQHAAFGEQLVFDAHLRSELADFTSADAIVRSALNPAHIPTPPVLSTVSDPHDDLPNENAARRNLAPVAIAAAGLIVTAGLTLASLRRRGIV